MERPNLTGATPSPIPASPDEKKQAAEQPAEEERTLGWWAWALCLVVAYICVGPGLIVLNKHILQTLKFSYPITLSSLGQVFIAAGAWLLVTTGHATISDEAKEQVSGRGWISCFFVGFFKALTLSFGNAVYLHLNMGYIQMLKAFSPVLMLFLLVLTGVESMPKCSVIGSVVVIAAFTAATTALEANATPMGLLLMGLAQGTEAMSLVLTQFLLKKKKMTIVESQYYLAPPTVFCMWSMAAFGSEWPTIYARGDLGIVAGHPVLFFLAATMGVVVNYLTVAVVKASSGTMLKVLGTVRNIIAVVVGAIVYSEVIPAYEWMCYGGSLLGFLSYTYFSLGTKVSEKEPTKRDEPQPDDEPDTVLVESPSNVRGPTSVQV